MKIGIIGTGNMGRALGIRWAQLGHDVFFGARRAEQSSDAANAAGNGAAAGSLDDAARFGEVLLWTLRDTEVARILADPSLLDGKVVIDLNNRDYANEAATGATFGEAIAERLQAAAPSTRVVKAFNTIALESFDITPDALRAAGAQTFLAGDDAEAKAIVASLAVDLGFAGVDAGVGVLALRTVEAMGDVIRVLMIAGGHGGRAHLTLTALPEPSLNTVGSRQPSNYH